MLLSIQSYLSEQRVGYELLASRSTLSSDTRCEVPSLFTYANELGERLVGDILISESGKKAGLICDYLRAGMVNTPAVMTMNATEPVQRMDLSVSAHRVLPTVLPLFISSFLDESNASRRGFKNNSLMVALESYMPNVSHSPTSMSPAFP